MFSATQHISILAQGEAARCWRTIQSATEALSREGVEPDREELAIMARYTRGEISLATLGALMDAYIEARL
jgi:hypothetical protein